MSEKWLEQFTKIVDKIGPFMLRKVKNSYPYLLIDLRKRMLFRDLCKKKHTKYHDPDDWLKCKQIRNEINIEMKTKRNSYFSQMMKENRVDIKETWRVLNVAMGIATGV